LGQVGISLEQWWMGKSLQKSCIIKYALKMDACCFCCSFQDITNIPTGAYEFELIHMCLRHNICTGKKVMLHKVLSQMEQCLTKLHHNKQTPAQLMK